MEVLANSLKLSHSVLDVCSDLIVCLESYKTKILKNQKKLKEAIGELEDNLMSLPSSEIEIKIEADAATGSINLQCVEPAQSCDGDDVIFEEHLEIEECPEAEAAPYSRTLKAKADRRKLCPDCGKTYSVHAFKRHYERVHLGIKKYQVS